MVNALMEGLNGTNIRASGALAQLMDSVEEYFGSQGQEGQNSNNETTEESKTKEQLREELARTKEQLSAEMSRYKDFNRRLDELGSEAQTLKDQLRDSHAHVRSLHQDKQRLEKQVVTMRARASDTHQPSASLAAPEANGNGWLATAASIASAAGAAVNGVASGAAAGGSGGAGLRELKLARSKSTPNTHTKRSSSLIRPQTGTALVSEHDELLVELAQAKTAEVIARAEAEEYKQKLESFKKAHGIPAGENPPAAASTAASAAATAAMGMFGRLTTAVSEASAKNTVSAPPASAASAPAAAAGTTPAPATNSAGFWGWRR